MVNTIFNGLNYSVLESISFKDWILGICELIVEYWETEVL